MAKKPPQAGDRVHISNIEPGSESVYVIQSPFGEAEVSMVSDDGDSVVLMIRAGFLRSGSGQRKGPGYEFTCPRNLVKFFEMVKAG